ALYLASADAASGATGAAGTSATAGASLLSDSSPSASSGFTRTRTFMVRAASALIIFLIKLASVPGGSLATSKTIASFSNRQRPLKIVPPPSAFLASAASFGGTLFLLTRSFPSVPLATKAKDIGFVFACFKALARSVSAMVTLQGG